jgi:hypothetical protein
MGVEKPDTKNLPRWFQAILNRLIKGRRVSINLGLAQDQLRLELKSGLSVTVQLDNPRVEGPEFVTGLKPWWLRVAAVKGSKGQVIKNDRGQQGEVRIPFPPEARKILDLRRFQVTTSSIQIDMELKGTLSD